MRQLIDPQLWRLADGGDEWAMYELQRRGPAHWRPARPNPRTDYVTQRLNGKWVIERWYGGTYGNFSTAEAAEAHLRKEERAKERARKKRR